MCYKVRLELDGQKRLIPVLESHLLNQHHPAESVMQTRRTRGWKSKKGKEDSLKGEHEHEQELNEASNTGDNARDASIIVDIMLCVNKRSDTVK